MCRKPTSTRLLGGRHAAYEMMRSVEASRNAPRYSVASRDAAGAALAQAAHEARTNVRNFVRLCILHDSEWDRYLRALKKVSSKQAAQGAAKVMQFHRDRLAGQSPLKQADLKSILRPIQNQKRSMGDLPSIGAPIATSLVPPSFHAWLEVSPVVDRPLSAAGGPAAKAYQWQLTRTGSGAAICPARAGGRVRSWRKTASGKDRVSAVPPDSLADSIAKKITLPTAVAAPGDHYFLVDEQRWFTVLENARAAGLRDDEPVVTALRDKSIISPIEAVSALGRAVHKRKALFIIEKLRRTGAIGNYCRYKSDFSGADIVAAAAREVFGPEHWAFIAASEPDAALRNVLLAAYGDSGLSVENLFYDAASEQSVHGDACDLYVSTPECQQHSRRNHHRSQDAVVTATRAFASSVKYVELARPRAIIVENVPEPDCIDAIWDVLCRIHGYDWFFQIIAADRNMGIPNARQRAFWVAIRSDIEYDETAWSSN